MPIIPSNLGKTITGGLDHLAGSTDEAFARTFDSKKGGGYTDPGTYTSAGDDLAGNTDEWFNRAVRHEAARYGSNSQTYRNSPSWLKQFMRQDQSRALLIVGAFMALFYALTQWV